MIWPFNRNKVGRASKIAIKPPQAGPDRQGICLVVIARNEGKRLNDWLTFHALAGVSHVVLYDNMSTDDTVAVARNFKGIAVTVVPWQLHTQTVKPALILPRQILAYCHAISTFGSRFRWMAMIDVDEYIVPRDDMRIDDVLADLNAFTNISLPWTMFGHAGHDEPPVLPIPYAFNRRARHATGDLLNFKCIVDPCDVTQVSTHKFETRKMGNASANTLGQISPNKQRHQANFVTTQGLQLNHYYLMSRAETAAKISNSDVAGVSRAKREIAIMRKAALIEGDSVDDSAAAVFLARHGLTDPDAFSSLNKR